MTHTDPSKRIPKSLGTDAKLFGTYTLADLAVALLPGVVVILLAKLVLPASLTVAGTSVETLALPVAGVAIGGGLVFVSLTPSHITSIDWLAAIVGFHRASSRLNHEAAAEHTHVEALHPRADAVERRDGTVLGAVKVDPPAMALATDVEWTRKADSFREFLNTTVEFPIQLYSTTRPFPVEEHLAEYEARLEDPDVQANPRLAALIEQYVEWYAADLDARQMTIRDHYVIVPVTTREVQVGETSFEWAMDLPVVGVLVRAWLAPDAETRRAAMTDALDDRLRRVEAGVRNIEGCSAHRADAHTMARLVEEYWSDRTCEDDDLRRALRTRQVVGGTR